MRRETIAKAKQIISEMMCYADNPMSMKKAREKGHIGELDSLCVCGLFSKSDDGIRILRPFVDKQYNRIKEMPQVYEEAQKMQCDVAMGRFNTAYLRVIFSLMDTIADNEGEPCHVQVKMTPDGRLPMTVENDHIRALVPPRVDNPYD